MERDSTEETAQKSQKTRKQLADELQKTLEQISELEKSSNQKDKVLEVLKDTLHHYRTLAELSQDCIFIIDREGFVQYVNCSAAKHLSSSPEKIIGKPLESLFPPDTCAIQKKNLQEVFQTRRCSTFVDKMKFPDCELWMDTVLTPMENKDGEIITVLGISRDITERKEAGRDIPEEKRTLFPNFYSQDYNLPLTRRECEILRLIASGLTNKQIADKLYISNKTVDTHRTRIMKKLDIHNTADLVRYALQSGIYSLFD